MFTISATLSILVSFIAFNLFSISFRCCVTDEFGFIVLLISSNITFTRGVGNPKEQISDIGSLNLKQEVLEQEVRDEELPCGK